MTYATLMVHVEAGHPNPGLLRLARQLADRFAAAVVGIAGCQPMRLVYDAGYVSGDIIQEDRDLIEEDLKTAEAAFRDAFHGHAQAVAWRAGVTLSPLADYIAREARCSDLVITGAGSKAPFGDTRQLDTGDLVMQVGRPVLVIPTGVNHLGLKRAVVAWKDTREARRAVLDALPLLRASDHVTVLGVAHGDGLTHLIPQLEDVVGWLQSHKVVATSLALPSAGDDASCLHDVVKDDGADLIIAGAYGHSRVREWALGGVTRDLLLRDDQCVFLSH